MRNTLFNREVEGYTREKYSTIKLGILALAVFSGFVFIGWIVHTITQILEVMIQMV